MKTEYDISEEEDFRKDVNEMCNLGEGIMEEGIAIGMEKDVKRASLSEKRGELLSEKRKESALENREQSEACTKTASQRSKSQRLPTRRWMR